MVNRDERVKKILVKLNAQFEFVHYSKKIFRLRHNKIVQLLWRVECHFFTLAVFFLDHCHFDNIFCKQNKSGNTIYANSFLVKSWEYMHHPKLLFKSKFVFGCWNLCCIILTRYAQSLAGSEAAGKHINKAIFPKCIWWWVRLSSEWLVGGPIKDESIPSNECKRR